LSFSVTRKTKNGKALAKFHTKNSIEIDGKASSSIQINERIPQSARWRSFKPPQRVGPWKQKKRYKKKGGKRGKIFSPKPLFPFFFKNFFGGGPPKKFDLAKKPKA